jgi:O-antigen biosynthesis protein WbqP
LPQFLSVIAGDMSIVGPRPMIQQHIELNAKRKKNGIDKLRPGITGWAQINGRDDLTNDEKLQLDMEYLKRQSICFDIFVMIKTLAYVFKASGVRH